MRSRLVLERFDPVQAATEPKATEEPGDSASADPAGDTPAPTEDSLGPDTLRSETLARIAAALSTVSADQAELRARCIEDVATALGEAAAAVLPRLAASAFPRLVADSTAAVARQGRWSRLRLSAAPDDAAEISAALADMGASADIDIHEAGSLEPGEARLDWDSGGAEIDAEAIGAAALDHYRQCVAGRMPAHAQARATDGD